MQIFMISDTHFSHKNIIKYCDRPFKNVFEMNKVMIDNWNKVVKKDDIVYHLGDFTIDTHNIKSLVDKLNGKIYLIRGNHDGKGIKFYHDVGLEVIPAQTKLDDYKFILSHRPLPDKMIPNGYINIHGHIHNKELDDKLFDRNKHICVAVERIDYTPIEIDKVLKLDGNYNG